MEAVVFSGVQALGKSTFYQQRFFRTHVRINLDMLKTRHREEVFLRACLETQQRFVVDNTNPTVEDRARYIGMAKAARFKVTGFYFQSNIQDVLARNAARAEQERIPEIGVRDVHAKLQIPSPDEGFDALYYVKMSPDGGFIVEEWAG
jgi:predicted kinase